MSHEAIGRSDEWYTPAYIFDALGLAFDMDVAHPQDHTHTHVPARCFLYVDGLDADWQGMIWMNPPFGGRGAVLPWMRRFLAHGNGVALTPDRTSAPWFRESWPHADMCLFMPKVRFIRPDGTTGDSPSNGTCLWACGETAVAGLVRAAGEGLGILAEPRQAVAA